MPKESLKQIINSGEKQSWFCSWCKDVAGPIALCDTVAVTIDLILARKKAAHEKISLNSLAGSIMTGFSIASQRLIAINREGATRKAYFKLITTVEEEISQLIPNRSDFILPQTGLPVILPRLSVGQGLNLYTAGLLHDQISKFSKIADGNPYVQRMVNDFIENVVHAKLNIIQNRPQSLNP